RMTRQGFTAESGAHASHTRHQILQKNGQVHIRRVHFIPGYSPLRRLAETPAIAPGEINGQHGFARARAPIDDSCVAGIEISPQRVEQSVSANARSLRWNHYFSGD